MLKTVPGTRATSVAALVGTALLLGEAGDLLLHTGAWGINLTVWVLMLTAGGIALIRLCSAGNEPTPYWPFALVILFAVCFAWRDSPSLKAMDVLGILAGLALTALRAPRARAPLSAISDYVLVALSTCSHAFAGCGALLANDIQWGHLRQARWYGRAPAAARGIALSVPLVIVFGGLFASADAAFAGILAKLVSPDLASVIAHVAFFLVCAWISAGLLRGMLFAPMVTSHGGIARQSLSLSSKTQGADLDESAGNWLDALPRLLSPGRIELCVILGLVDCLFLVFVAVQLRYYFGGGALVEASATLTYAEYARRGFFELVIVAALVLPLLLTSHWLLGETDRRALRAYRLLAGTQIALLAVIIVSALRRMHLYEQVYGLTELRLYTTAFMLWLAAVFLWFIPTVLAGRRSRFATGAIAAGFVAIFALHVLNPNALMTNVNVQRATNGHDFDAHYALTLGADAVPELLAGFPGLSAPDRCLVGRELQRRWLSPRGNWRAWSLASEAARRAVQDRASTLWSESC